MKIRINADDFGISPGVNAKIIEMYRSQKLDSASLIFGCGYESEAIELAQLNLGLKVGLHLNLTTGKARSLSPEIMILVDKQRRFKYGFISLLLLSVFSSKKLDRAVRVELEAQLLTLKNADITINHIDSHRHVHIIPRVFKIVNEVARKHNIKTIRVINESFWYTWAINYKKNFLFNGGIVKFLVLKCLSLFNKPAVNSEYFFSILYSCTLSRELIEKINIPGGYKKVEIMIHPGNPERDMELILEEQSHLISKNRNQESL